jgi:AcrR family transcriptional regulator
VNRRGVKRRTYDGEKRRAGSLETKKRIFGCARRVFIERGYRAATVAEIARGARVNVDTVYELVGRKPLILRELIEQAISGSDKAIIAEERDYVRAIVAEPDPARKIEIYAKAVADIQQRLAPLFAALRDAAVTEPEAAEVWREISSRRHANMRKLAVNLRESGGLRNDLTLAAAADLLWTMNSAEVYLLLTSDRGWTTKRYERWLADTWRRMLLKSSEAD